MTSSTFTYAPGAFLNLFKSPLNSLFKDSKSYSLACYYSIKITPPLSSSSIYLISHTLELLGFVVSFDIPLVEG